MQSVRARLRVSCNRRFGLSLRLPPTSRRYRLNQQTTPQGRRTVSRESKMTAAKSRVLIEQYFDTLMQGGDISELFTEDIVWHLPRSSPMGGPFRGREAVLTMLGAGVGLFDPSSLSIELHAIAADHDQAAARFTLKATTVAGAAYENDYLFFFACANGRISAVWESLDTLHQQQTGLFAAQGDPA